MKLALVDWQGHVLATYPGANAELGEKVFEKLELNPIVKLITKRSLHDAVVKACNEVEMEIKQQSIFVS